MSKTFNYQIRVQSEHTDYNGIVHHANYIKFMEQARVEWVYSFGARLDEYIKNGTFFVVKHLEVDYFKPAHFYDTIEVATSLVSAKRVSKVCEQIIRDPENHEHIYCRGLVTVACVNKQFRPCAIPKEIIRGMQA